MKIPYLKKKPELKSCHDVTWEDEYSWIHQNNILEVLRNNFICFYIPNMNCIVFRTFKI